jgi:hypothetical protein
MNLGIAVTCDRTANAIIKRVMANAIRLGTSDCSHQMQNSSVIPEHYAAEFSTAAFDGVIKSGRKELKGLRGAKIKGKSSEQGVWSNDEAINR